MSTDNKNNIGYTAAFYGFAKDLVAAAPKVALETAYTASGLGAVVAGAQLVYAAAEFTGVAPVAKRAGYRAYEIISDNTPAPLKKTLVACSQLLPGVTAQAKDAPIDVERTLRKERLRNETVNIGGARSALVATESAKPVDQASLSQAPKPIQALSQTLSQPTIPINYKQETEKQKDIFVSNTCHSLIMDLIFKGFTSADYAEMVRAIRTATETATNPEEAFEKELKTLFFQKLHDKGLSSGALLWAKAKYFFLLPIYKYIAGNIASAFLKEVFDYIGDQENVGFLDLYKGLLGSLTNYTAILTEAYTPLPNNSSSTLSKEKLNKELSKEENTSNLSLNEIYGRFGQDVLAKAMGSRWLGLLATLFVKEDVLIKGLIDQTIGNLGYDKTTGLTNVLDITICQQLEALLKGLDEDTPKDSPPPPAISPEEEELAVALVTNLFTALQKINPSSSFFEKGVDAVMPYAYGIIGRVVAQNAKAFLEKDQLEQIVYNLVSSLNKPAATDDQKKEATNKISSLTTDVITGVATKAIESYTGVREYKKINETIAFLHKNTFGFLKEGYKLLGDFLKVGPVRSLESREHAIKAIRNLHSTYQNLNIPQLEKVLSTKLSEEGGEILKSLLRGLQEHCKKFTTAIAMLDTPLAKSIWDGIGLSLNKTSLNEHLTNLKKYAEEIGAETVCCDIALQLLSSLPLDRNPLDKQVEKLTPNATSLKEHVTQLKEYAKKLDSDKKYPILCGRLKALITHLDDPRFNPATPGPNFQKYQRNTIVLARRLAEREIIQKGVDNAKTQLLEFATWTSNNLGTLRKGTQDRDEKNRETTFGQQIEEAKLESQESRQLKQGVLNMGKAVVVSVVPLTTITRCVKGQFKNLLAFARQEETVRFGVLHHCLLIPYVKDKKRTILDLDAAIKPLLPVDALLPVPIFKILRGLVAGVGCAVKKIAEAINEA